MSRRVEKQYAGQGVLADRGAGITFDWGLTVPSDGAAGYAPGCIFQDVDAAAGAQLFVNEGTAASADFNAIITLTGGATVTTLTVTTLTAPTIAGTTAFTGRVTTTDGVASGTARVVGGLAYSNVAASASVGGTSAETVFDQSYTIPANTLKAGTHVKIRYAGFGVTGIGTDTFAHKLYIGGSGGTAIVTSGAAQLATNATFLGECELICRTAGTTGTFAGIGTYKQSSAEGTMTVKDDIVRSTTINTTANQAVVVTGTWNNANATSAILDILTVDIY